MRNSLAIACTGLLCLTSTVRLVAQRYSFEQTIDVPVETALDIATTRGRIDVSAGEPGKVTVRGTVTVRVGLDVPLDAASIAKRLAANPPIQRENNTLRLRPPNGDAERRAVTIAYEVIAPKRARVDTRTDSGATSVRDVTGPVSVTTQSAAIDLRDLGGSVEIRTGSGSVTASNVGGDMNVSTESSSITLRNMKAGLRARTQSGAVNAIFTGKGDVDVETGSSAIDLSDVNGGLSATSNSGSMRISGVPTSPWRANTGSSRIDLAIHRDATFTLDARSDSSDVELDGFAVDGTTRKGVAAGNVRGGRGGGPVVRAASRSGRIRVGLRP
jgi:Putative adhesin